MNDTDTIDPVSRKPRRDTAMTTRQLASTVRQGRKISISILDEDPVDGYLAGWDEETYFLLVPYDEWDSVSATRGYAFFKVLIPKRNILRITLIDERTFREEPAYREMDPVLKKFRDAVNAKVFEPEEN